MNNKKLKKTLKELVNLFPEVKREIYHEVYKEDTIEDISLYCGNYGIPYNEEDFEKIFKIFYEEEDFNCGLWENIASAIEIFENRKNI